MMRLLSEGQVNKFMKRTVSQAALFLDAAFVPLLASLLILVGTLPGCEPTAPPTDATLPLDQPELPADVGVDASPPDDLSDASPDRGPAIEEGALDRPLADATSDTIDASRPEDRPLADMPVLDTSRPEDLPPLADVSLSCVDENLGSRLGFRVATGDTTGRPSRVSSTACLRGGGSAGEVIYGFTAPRDGYYSFDTRGSEAPVMVALLAEGCGSRVRECASVGLTQELAALTGRRLRGGEPVVVVVDSNTGSTGRFVLNILFEGAPTSDGTAAYRCAGHVPTFSAPVATTFPGVATAVAAADFNGDRSVDLAVVNEMTDQVSLLPGDGAGAFRAPVVIPGTRLSAVTGLLADDADRDGDVDLFALGFDVWLLVNNRDGTFTPRNLFPVPGGATGSGVVADLDGDGARDLTVASRNSPGGAYLAFGDGRGGFSTPTVLRADGPIDEVTVGDLNGDGRHRAPCTQTVPRVNTPQRRS